MPSFEELERRVLTREYQSAAIARDDVMRAFNNGEITEAQRDTLLGLITPEYRPAPPKPRRPRP